MSDDIFDDAPAATGVPRPHIQQLAKGAKPADRFYAKGEPQEFKNVKMAGRLIIIEPTKIEADVPSGIKGDDGKVKLQTRITANIHVLDGEPIKEQLDGDGDVKVTFKEPLVPPFVVSQQYISNTMLVDQLRDVVGTGIRFGALGFLPSKGGRKKPYVLFSTTPEEKKKAQEYWKNRPDPFDNADV